MEGLKKSILIFGGTGFRAATATLPVKGRIAKATRREPSLAEKLAISIGAGGGQGAVSGGVALPLLVFLATAFCTAATFYFITLFMHLQSMVSHIVFFLQ